MEDFFFAPFDWFMGGLQVNSLVFTSQNEKRLAILPVFFRFLFIFQFLNQCKNSILRDRFYHFIGQDFPFPINTSGRSIPFSRI